MLYEVRPKEKSPQGNALFLEVLVQLGLPLWAPRRIKLTTLRHPLMDDELGAFSIEEAILLPPNLSLYSHHPLVALQGFPEKRPLSNQSV